AIVTSMPHLARCGLPAREAIRRDLGGVRLAAFGRCRAAVGSVPVRRATVRWGLASPAGGVLAARIHANHAASFPGPENGLGELRRTYLPTRHSLLFAREPR